MFSNTYWSTRPRIKQFYIYISRSHILWYCTLDFQFPQNLKIIFQIEISWITNPVVGHKSKIFKNHIWYLIYDTWYLILDGWYLISDIWYLMKWYCCLILVLYLWITKPVVRHKCWISWILCLHLADHPT